MAANNAIASGSAIITANADGLKAGLDKAANQVQQFGDKTNKSLGGEGGGGLLGKFKGGMAFGAGMLAIQGIAKGAEFAIAKFTELGERMDKIGEHARLLGTNTEFLSGLGYAAEISGVDVETLNKSLDKFRQNVDGPLDEALMNFGKRIEDIEDPGERARAFVDAFGKSGQKMQLLFEDGADGLQKMIDEAKELGVAFNDIDSEKVQAANDAIDKSKAVFRSLFQGLIAGFAPVIEGIANAATSVMKWLRPAFDWMSRAFTQVFDIAVWVFEAIGEAIGDVVDWVGELLGSLFGFAGEAPSIQQIVVDMFRTMGLAAAYVWDVIKAGAGIVAIGIGKVIETFGTLFEGIGEVVKGIADLAIAAGVFEESAARMKTAVDGWSGSIKGTGAGMVRWGEGTLNNFGKSADQFDAWLDKKLKGKAKDKKDEISDALEVKADPIKLAGALVRGTKEAYSLIVSNQFRGMLGGDPAKKQLDAQKQANRKLDKVVDNTAKVAKAVEDIGDF